MKKENFLISAMLRGGYAFKSKDFKTNGIPLVRISNIKNERVEIEGGSVYLEEKDLLNYKEYQVNKGDILIALSGATTGKFGIYDLDTPALLNQRVGMIKILKMDKILSNYLYYYVYSITKKILKKAQGAAQPNISTKSVENFNITLFPISKQKKIVQTLDTADDFRQKRKEQLKLLDDYLKSIFLEMFGDPIINPKKWPLKKFNEVGTLDRGISKNRPRNAPELLGGPYPLIQTGDISNSEGYIKEYQQTYSEIGFKQSKMWPVGTLCITIAANIAKTGILTFKACFPDSVVGFAPNDSARTEYIQMWMSFLQKILEDKAPESAQKNINLGILRNLDVTTPPIDLQNKFASIVEQVEQTKKKMRASLNEMDNHFNALMQRCFG